MRNYYLIRQESDPKVIGVKSGLAQIEFFHQDESYRQIDHFFNISTYWDKSDFALPESISMSTLKAQILKGAKWTDFMRFRPYLIGCPFVINEMVKTILNEFLMPQHYFIPVQVFNNNHVSDLFYLLYMPDLSFEVIDFPKSIFYTGGIGTAKKEIPIANREEYSFNLSKSPTMGIDRVVLTNKFDDNLDFFSTRLGNLFVSQRLREKILSENLMGLKVFDEHYLPCETAK